jgi:hypothetical protein
MHASYKWPRPMIQHWLSVQQVRLSNLKVTTCLTQQVTTCLTHHEQLDAEIWHLLLQLPNNAAQHCVLHIQSAEV